MTSSAAARHALEPAYVDGRDGRLFTLYTGADPAVAQRGSLLMLAALADEQNKARHVVAESCRRACGLGYSVLQVDLHGTGDSEGEFDLAECIAMTPLGSEDLGAIRAHGK